MRPIYALLVLLAMWPNLATADETRVVRLRYEIRNTTGAPVTGASLQAFVPIDTPYQRRAGLRVDAEYTLTTSPGGNAWVSVPLGMIPPHGQRRVTVTATLEVAVLAADASAREAAGPRPAVDQREESAISELARQLKTPQQMYAWIVRNVQDSGFHARDRGAGWTLANRKGDCSDMAQLLVALSRSAGVPARYVSGYLVDRSALLTPNAYHSWAELWVDGGWHLMDPQGRVADGSAADRVATSVGGAQTDTPLAGSYRFRVEGGEGLSVHMVGRAP